MKRRALLTWAAILAVVVAGACGGDSPSSPSAGSGGVVVKGVVLGDGAAVTASSGSPVAAGNGQKVTVRVEGTTITAEVSANGTFELRGIPSGTFTLVFLVNGNEIGRVVVTAEEGSEVRVVVQVSNSVLVLVDIRVDSPDPSPSRSPSPSASPGACIINGGRLGQGIELEGNVTSRDALALTFKMRAAGATDLVDVGARAASFRCIGGAKAETEAACKASFWSETSQTKVHVRGTLMVCSALGAQVTAAEVKVQKN